MTLILSGTDGLSDIDGSAATPAVRGTDTNTGIFFGADIIGFAEGGAEVARFDSSGNLLVGTTSAATPSTTGYISVANTFGFKNRLINSAMVIDQRNAGASGTGNDNYTVDRWAYFGSQASKGTWQQNAGSVTPPTGFSKYWGFTSSSAYSVGATELFVIGQKIEGFNFSDLAFGSASASTVTISFWVRSSLTGTFGGYLANSSQNRNYPFSYTISSANTWEQKTITIAGDTTGTWIGSTNQIGARVNFSLGIGSTNSTTANAWNGTTNAVGVTGATSVVGTNGATFYITGVQLEKGSTATSFDYRPYGTELILCQRYYYKISTQSIYGIRYGGTSPFFNTGFPVTMRATPTVTPTLVSTIFTSAGTVNSLPIKDTTADSVSIQVNTSNVSVDFGITYNYTASIEL